MKAATLLLKHVEIDNVFHLLGDKEDSISLAIAWAFSKCPHFLVAMLEDILDHAPKLAEPQIQIHQWEEDGGITDIELLDVGSFHFIIEAKKGWILPEKQQLEKYAQRKSFLKNKTADRRIFSLSECSKEYADLHLPLSSIRSIPIQHISWKDIWEYANTAMKQSGHVEKRILSELIGYLEEIMNSQDRESNLVYVVSLSSHPHDRWKTSWIEIVEKYSRYFHPVAGGGWPKEPPAYIGFRYKGQLQSIHFIEDYEVIDNLSSACKGIPNEPVEPHYLYKLGPRIVPDHAVKNGAIWPNGRYWCAIDTLLTSSTVQEARDITKRRGLA